MGKSRVKVYLDDKTYEVIDVKNGGMGRVWLLETSFDYHNDPIYRPRIAAKTFELTPQHHAIKQELNSWVALDHEHIVSLVKIGRLNYHLAAIMSWLDGSIDDDLSSNIIYSERKSVIIAIQIAKALNYAFERYGLVHLDLKPSNILYRSKEPIWIQVSDWGISRLSAKIAYNNWLNISSVDQLTAYGAGTPLYMSPERFSRAWHISPQADIYSLGMMIVEMLTGILPFRLAERSPYDEIICSSYMDNAKNIINCSSTRLNNILFSCIHPDPRKRPASHAALIHDLQTCL